MICHWDFFLKLTANKTLYFAEANLKGGREGNYGYYKQRLEKWNGKDFYGEETDGVKLKMNHSLFIFSRLNVIQIRRTGIWPCIFGTA